MQFIFSTPVLIRHLWQLKTAVFLHRCLICTVPLLFFSQNDRAYRHGGEDDEGELPAVDEGVDDACGEDGHEEEEHADFLADALLKLVQVPEKVQHFSIGREVLLKGKAQYR